MARIPFQPCNCEDYPCCGHQDVALTGDDLADVSCPYCGIPGCLGGCEDDYRDEPDESMDGDFDSAMASAGFGTDEDYGYYGDYDETPIGMEYDGYDES
jgi:hypothetical protein